MKTLKFSDREEWLAARRGKITGTRLKDIVSLRGNTRKMGFWELIAERLGLPADEENAMDRGTRLEDEAMAEFVKATGKKVKDDLVIWVRDENENIAISPDGVIGKKEAVEIKCLSSARHIEALVTQKIPSEYEMQAIQYFIVNDSLETLYMAFYDPRLLIKPFFFLTVKREQFAEEIETYRAFEETTLKEVEQIVTDLSF